MVLVLQTKLSNGQMHSSEFVGLQSMPLRQQVESRQSEGQPRLEVAPDTMSHMLNAADGMQHGKGSLNHHSRVPLSSLAYQQVGGIASLEGEQLVSQYDHPLFVLSNHRVESRIMHISSGTVPIHNQTPLVEQQAEFAANYPFVVGEAFAPHLMGSALVSPGVEQLYSVSVSYSEQGRLSHEAAGPLLMGSEQAEQAGTLRQSRKHAEQVTLYPAVEGPIAYSFDGEQQSQCHYLARVQTGLAMLGHIVHGIIYSAKQFRDKIGCRHEVLLQLWSEQQQLRRTLCFCQTSTIG
jgi:hypothetical protein